MTENKDRLMGESVRVSNALHGLGFTEGYDKGYTDGLTRRDPDPVEPGEPTRPPTEPDPVPPGEPTRPDPAPPSGPPSSTPSLSIVATVGGEEYEAVKP